MFKVVETFEDLKDGKHLYNVGDVYPHKGAKKPTKSRINELSTDKNRRKLVLIEEVPVPSEDEDTAE